MAIILFLASPAGTAAAATVNVRVIDALSNAPLIGQSVILYEESATGERVWRRNSTTGADGQAQLEVPGLSPGSRYIARSKPYAQWIERPVESTGTVDLPAGLVRVELRSGVNGQPLPGVELELVTIAATGAYAKVTTVMTDSAGNVRLDPASLGNTTYALRGPSPIDGSTKYSPPIVASGTFRFSLGNPPVTVLLSDWSSDQPLVDETIEFREQLADGTLRWTTSRVTDGDGRVRIDLDGLEDGRHYVLRTKPYLQHISRDITSAGWLAIRAGTVPATILNGDTGLPLKDTEVQLLKQSADGTRQLEFKVTTSADGLLHLDPIALGTSPYYLQAASPVDSSLKISEPIQQAGALTFAVGNRSLSVRVVDSSTSVPIDALAVTAHELLANGKRGAAIVRSTTPDGIARFDLDGLGAGRRYLLRMKPFEQWIEREIDAAGWIEINAGLVRVNVLNGATTQALPNQEVKLLALQPDGSRRTVQTFRSSADGRLVLDPVDLGGTSYILSATSPLDGSLKYSQPIVAPGQVHFAVGSAGLVVKIRDWTSEAPLSRVTVNAYELGPDNVETWVAQRISDDLGRASFDLDGLVSGRRHIIKLKPYNQFIVHSVDAPAVLSISAGPVRVTVQRGDDGFVLPNTPVRVLSILKDGNYEHLTTLESDARGELVLDLPALDTTQYVLRAASPIDGSLKYSAPITGPGPLTFRVGSRPLLVQLVNQQSKEPLASQRLDVLELHADDTRTWLRQASTDENGRVVLDLDGLGAGRRYVVRTKPYAQWLEEIVALDGDLQIEAGGSPVRFVDADSGAPFAGVEVRALNKLGDGRLLPAFGSGTTDNEGLIRFDPDGLDGTASVVYQVLAPYRSGVNYYTAPTIATGPQTFMLSRNGPTPLDRTPAELAVTTPRANHLVANTGFLLEGKANDNVGLREVVIEVRKAGQLVTQCLATIDPDTQTWSASIAGQNIAPDTSLTVTVTAVDLAYNHTVQRFTVNAVDDITPPTVVFRAPLAESITNGRGVLVLGAVRDDTQWASLIVRVEDDAGRVLAERPAEIAPPNGDWAFAIPGDMAHDTARLTIRATATDQSGNSAAMIRSFKVDPNADALQHVLSRITFGASPSLLAEVRAIGYTAYLSQQLSPALIDDSALESRLQALPTPSLYSLQQATLLRMTTSRRQLNEVMTWFWENHFNTDYRRHGQVDWENQENEAFRTHALGRFRDLLSVSAHSPAMLYYLDNVRSNKSRPNENYARELAELHTLGTGYTQQDVAEIARVFTGWSVENNAFKFDAGAHDDGEKQLLGISLPAGGGEQDGEALIDFLAAHPNTAKHICTRLGKMLVADNPPASLVNRCAATFTGNRDEPDQIARTVRTVVLSPEFRSAVHRGNKAKTAVEFVAGLARSTDALGDGSDLARATADLGQPLFNFPIPTGYSLESSDWTGPYQLRQRMTLVGRATDSNATGTALHVHSSALLAGIVSVKTTEGVAARMLLNAQASTFDSSDLETAVSVLTSDGTRRFTLDAADADIRLRRLARTILSLPRYQVR